MRDGWQTRLMLFKGQAVQGKQKLCQYSSTGWNGDKLHKAALALLYTHPHAWHQPARSFSFFCAIEGPLAKMFQIYDHIQEGYTL